MLPPIYSGLLLLVLAVFARLTAQNRDQTAVQESWVSPAYHSDRVETTVLASNELYRVEWSKGTDGFLSEYCTACNITDVDLWIASYDADGTAQVSQLLYSGINLRNGAVAEYWTGDSPASIFCYQWAFCFVPGGWNYSEAYESDDLLMSPPVSVVAPGSSSSATQSCTVPTSMTTTTTTSTAPAASTTDPSATTSSSISSAPAVSSSGLSTGAKVGIGIGAGLGALVIVILAIFAVRFARGRRAGSTSQWDPAESKPELEGRSVAISSTSPPMTDQESNGAGHGVWAPYEADGNQVPHELPVDVSPPANDELPGEGSPSPRREHQVAEPAGYDDSGAETPTAKLGTGYGR